EADMKTNQRDMQRGAVLIHVAFAILVLIAFSVFVFDYGVLWASRRQAQNAADASAHAGAVALAFDDFNNRSDTGPAKVSAINTGAQNFMWGVSKTVNAADLTFPDCPDKSKACIRVDVYRDGTNGSAGLPFLFGSILGLSTQGIKATATAEVMAGDATDCLKPWAVIDKWSEVNPTPGPWTVDSTFDKYDKQGNPTVVPPDVYIAPTEDDFGTGFHPYDDKGGYTTDYGLELSLKLGAKNDFN